MYVLTYIGLVHQRSTPGVLLHSSLSYFVRQSLLLGLLFAISAGVTSHKAPGVCLSLHPQCWVIGTHHHVQGLTLVLGILSQVLLIAQQAYYPLNLLPIP